MTVKFRRFCNCLATDIGNAKYLRMPEIMRYFL